MERVRLRKAYTSTCDIPHAVPIHFILSQHDRMLTRPVQCLRIHRSCARSGRWRLEVWCTNVRGATRLSCGIQQVNLISGRPKEVS